MADRHVLLIDTDKAFHETLKKALHPYGVAVVAVDDGSDGMNRVREVNPELLFIAVELPKKEGYGLFSRAKKGSAKSIPVALVTSTVTPDDFSKHKKLSTHAEEYIDKRTIKPDELVRRIDALIQLGPAQVADEDLELAVEEAEEFSIDEDMAVVDDGSAEAAETTGVAGQFGDESTRLQQGIPSNLVDEGIDAETNAAFEALGMGGEDSFETEDKASTTNVSARPDAAMMEMGDAAAVPVAVEVPGKLAMNPPGPGTELEVSDMTLDGADGLEEEPTPVHTPPPVPLTVARTPAGLDDDLDLGLDAVAAEASTPAGDGQVVRIAELETEVEKLRRDLAAARSAAADKPGTQPPGAAGSREKEFKNLREMISRKEKELDDLKEEIENKDKQIQAGKDKLKELSHKLREADEKTLNVQEELLAANGVVTTLGQDKDKGLEREKGLKARLEVSQTEVRKAHEEVDQLKKKLVVEHQTGTDALAKEKAEHEKTKGDAAAKVAAVESAQAKALAMAEARRQQELASLKSELEGAHGALVASVESDRETKLTALAKDHENVVGALRDEHSGEIAALHAAHEDAHAKKDRERVVALQQAASEREKALSAAEERRVADLADAEEKRLGDLATLTEQARQDQAEALTRAEAEKQAALGEAEKRRGEEIFAADRRRVAELDAAEKKRVDDLAAADARKLAELAAEGEKHTSEVAAVTASFESERGELETAHAAVVAKLQEEVAGLQRAIAGARESQKALEGQLVERGQTIAAREQTIAAREADIVARDGNIAALKTEIGELEGQNAQFQEQVLRAYQKIKTDEATVTKAKKAMAIALTLLDEQKQAQ